MSFRSIRKASPDLAFNTAVSFVTNTNWQSYGGEMTMSHLTQMVGLTVQNFVSAATGIALAIAVTRAFARSGAKELGNFWIDVTRATLYVLLPLSVVVALLYAISGVPQTLAGSFEVTTLEGAKQTIAVGPVASQEAIKQLGTNGGASLRTLFRRRGGSTLVSGLQLFLHRASPHADGRITARASKRAPSISVATGLTSRTR